MKIMTVVLAAAMTVSCTKQKETPVHQIDSAQWLLGNWGHKTAQGQLTESWQKTNDSTYAGQSYFIKAKDTLFAETIVLSENKGDLLYTVTVAGQNGDLPVAFKLTSGTASQLVFENPAHDYPKKITYNLIRNDSMVAQISGTQQGKPVSEQFPMSKTAEKTNQ